eukprot:tig00020939_g16060.t1
MIESDSDDEGGPRLRGLRLRRLRPRAEDATAAAAARPSQPPDTVARPSAPQRSSSPASTPPPPRRHPSRRRGPRARQRCGAAEAVAVAAARAVIEQLRCVVHVHETFDTAMPFVDETVDIVIPPLGADVQRLWLKVTLPALTNADHFYIPKAGYVLLKKVKIFVGAQLIHDDIQPPQRGPVRDGVHLLAPLRTDVADNTKIPTATDKPVADIYCRYYNEITFTNRRAPTAGFH